MPHGPSPGDRLRRRRDAPEVDRLLSQATQRTNHLCARLEESVMPPAWERRHLCGPCPSSVYFYSLPSSSSPRLLRRSTWPSTPPPPTIPCRSCSAKAATTSDCSHYSILWGLSVPNPNLSAGAFTTTTSSELSPAARATHWCRDATPNSTANFFWKTAAASSPWLLLILFCPASWEDQPLCMRNPAVSSSETSPRTSLLQFRRRIQRAWFFISPRRSIPPWPASPANFALLFAGNRSPLRHLPSSHSAVRSFRLPITLSETAPQKSQSQPPPHCLPPLVRMAAPSRSHRPNLNSQQPRPNPLRPGQRQQVHPPPPLRRTTFKRPQRSHPLLLYRGVISPSWTPATAGMIAARPSALRSRKKTLRWLSLAACARNSKAAESRRLCCATLTPISPSTIAPFSRTARTAPFISLCTLPPTGMGSASIARCFPTAAKMTAALSAPGPAPNHRSSPSARLLRQVLPRR